MKIISGIVTVAVLAALLMAGGVLMLSSGPTEIRQQSPANADIQIAEIMAKGGYNPSSLTLKADTEGLLRITTQNTFDCSGAIIIRALNYQARLPITGITEITIPPQPAGSSITGTCGMGMYHFTLSFS